MGTTRTEAEGWDATGAPVAEPYPPSGEAWARLVAAGRAALDALEDGVAGDCRWCDGEGGWEQVGREEPRMTPVRHREACPITLLAAALPPRPPEPAAQPAARARSYDTCGGCSAQLVTVEQVERGMCAACWHVVPEDRA